MVQGAFFKRRFYSQNNIHKSFAKTKIIYFSCISITSFPCFLRRNLSFFSLFRYLCLFIFARLFLLVLSRECPSSSSCSTPPSRLSSFTFSSTILSKLELLCFVSLFCFSSATDASASKFLTALLSSSRTIFL